MSVSTPTYGLRFSGSSGWINQNFGSGYTNQISSLKIKGGLTSAIGSFEITIPDTGSQGEAFNNIPIYNDVYIWLGYNFSYTDPPFFRGKIDTIKTNYDRPSGWLRTYSGRDYGEALFRIIDRIHYSGSASGSIILLKDRAGLNSDNSYISSSNISIYVIQNNDNCFKSIEEISNNVSVTMDFYVDIYKKLHWFPRQSIIGPEAFSVGTNIKSYRYFKEIADSKNQYYIFGSRDPSSTGSDWPVNHDGYTDGDTTGWTGSCSSGSNPWVSTGVVGDGVPATGSFSHYINVTVNNASIASLQFYMRKQLPDKIMLNSGDFLHFYHGRQIASAQDPEYIKIRLETDENNYYETYLEAIDGVDWTTVPANRIEYNIPLGPDSEGSPITGSKNTSTGSYKWFRVGSPNWYNINYFKLLSSGSLLGLSLGYAHFVDGLYFGTRFQYQTGSTGSQTLYGLRESTIIDGQFNSKEYCINLAAVLLMQNSGSITQIELVTTGSPSLVMGNRYALTIPSEGISSQYFELMELEHSYDASNGFTSKCLFTDKKQLRVPIPVIYYPTTNVVEKKRFWFMQNQPWWAGGWY